MNKKNDATRVTLGDIAKLANVSAMTVSKALNNRPGISADKRAEILMIAANLNYQPNLLARSLRTGQTKTIGTIFNTHFRGVFEEVFRGIQEHAQQQGYSTIISAIQANEQEERNALDLLLNQRVDGVIFVSPIYFDRYFDELTTKACPPIVLAMRDHPNPAISTVINDNYQGAFELLDELLSEKTRRPAFISLEQSYYSTRHRLKGWRDACAKHEITFDDCPLLYSKPIIKQSYRRSLRLLQDDPSIDLMVCGSDMIALGAIEAALSLNLRIPDQIRICGYDDMPLSAHFRVPLTTVHQPLYEIGAQSVQLLLNNIVTRNQVEKIVLKNKIIRRESA